MLNKSYAKHWVQQAGRAVDGLRLGFAAGTIWPGLIVAICAGIGIRFVVHLDQGFWEDEIIAVTHAVQPLPQLFIEVARNDVHPPLYFLQLHFWSWVSHADLWFVANSVVWGLAALLSLWIVQRRVGGEASAWTATAYLAVLPAGLWMSQEVRPYAMLSVLFIWTYGYAERCFATSQARRRDYWVLFLLCFVTIYTHAVGFYAVLFNGLFAFALLIRRRAPWGDFARFVVVYGLTAVASVPMLISDLLHDANQAAAGAAGMLLWTSAVVTVGGPPRIGGSLVYFGVVAAGLAVARTRLVTACFLIVPLLIAVGLDLMLKPIFKANIFAAMMAPFLAIVLAEVTLAVRPKARKVVAAGGLSVLLAMSLIGWVNKSRSTDFLPAVTDIMAAMRPGDIVYVPQNSMFWGMAWYLGGPDWGSPLDIASPPNAQWQHILSRIGPRLVESLHLMPKTQAILLPNGLTLATGGYSVPQGERGRRVWLITYERVDLPPGMPPDHFGTLGKSSERQYSHLVVSLYE